MRPAVLPGWLKPALFLLCLAPAAELAHGAWAGTLGVNPLETLTRGTGEWTLRLLLATLAVTPLIRLTGRPELLRLRRMLGLFAFFYACLHFGTYLWFDKFFDWTEIWLDVRDRLFITAGFAAFALLVPLAATSTRGMQRRLGRAWNRLHRLVYAAAAAGVLHYFWLVKADVFEPALYAAVFLLLMLARLRRPGAVSAPAAARRGPG